MKALEQESVPKYWFSCVSRIGCAAVAISLVLALASCAPVEAENHERGTTAPGSSALEETSKVEPTVSETPRKGTAAIQSPATVEAKSSDANLQDPRPEPATKDVSQSESSTKAELEGWKKSTNGLKIAKDADAATKIPERTEAVTLKKPVSAGSEAQMRIGRIEKTRGEAKGIGEISGTAVLVEVVINNDGSDDLDLSRAQVRLFYGNTVLPAATLNDSRTVTLKSALPQGGSTKATFIFSAPTDWDGRVLVEFETGNTQKIQQLVGKVK